MFGFRRALHAVLGTALLGTLLVVATPAYAGHTRCWHADLYQRETVCAQDLFVRTSPGGAWQGTLYQGQTFYVERIEGDWVYGFAYGYINRHGWVQNGWFYP